VSEPDYSDMQEIEPIRLGKVTPPIKPFDPAVAANIASVKQMEAQVAAVEIISRLTARVAELEAALREVMIGGNHLAVFIDGNGPNYRATASEGLAFYGAGPAYEAWCCWRAIMRARAALKEAGGGPV
jgi:hypothetical protein